MAWFFAFLIVAAMGVVAVVASGRGGTMAETYDDRPDSRVQADGPLRPVDLRRVRFSTAFRGYRMSEVDSLLDRLAVELEDAHGRDADDSDEGEGPAPTDETSDSAEQPAQGAQTAVNSEQSPPPQ
ncbi:MAG TPA: DivIVA domain-containing protein [Nocardioidaceae bacterium]|nr:DivIVA domain-containing protein [Nocardioidaceae bacterium]